MRGFRSQWLHWVWAEDGPAVVTNGDGEIAVSRHIPSKFELEFKRGVLEEVWVVGIDRRCHFCFVSARVFLGFSWEKMRGGRKKAADDGDGSRKCVAGSLLSVVTWRGMPLRFVGPL